MCVSVWRSKDNFQESVPLSMVAFLVRVQVARLAQQVLYLPSHLFDPKLVIFIVTYYSSFAS